MHQYTRDILGYKHHSLARPLILTLHLYDREPPVSVVPLAHLDLREQLVRLEAPVPLVLLDQR